MLRAPRPPWLLPGPTRIAAIGRVPAIAVLATLAVLALLILSGPAPEWPADTMTRIAFQDALIERLRHGGEDYYTAAAATLRGHDLPLIPATAFPMPALPVIAAALPGAIGLLVLALLTGLTVTVWSRRFAARRAGRAAAGIAALLGGGGWLILPALAGNPALWAGLLVSLSLGLATPRRRVEPLALATAAALLHPGAALILPVMAVFAWRDGARRQAGAWLAALGIAAIAFACHAAAARTAARGFAGEAPAATPAGLAEALHAVAAGGGLAILPAALAMAMPVFAVLGWAIWRSGAGLRVAAVLVVLLLAAALLPVGALAIALVAAPIAPLGLVPAIEGLRDLIVAALDNRRITVTRIVR